MNTYFTKILRHIKTTSDADTLLSQIDQVLENLYQVTSVSLNELLDQNLSTEVATEIKNAFHEHGLSWEHHEEVKSFFINLKLELAKCKVITLTLAYHPTEKHLKRLKMWTEKNLTTSFIFEIEHDESIIAGAIIILNGQYLDLSVKRKLDAYFAAQTDSKQTSNNTPYL